MLSRGRGYGKFALLFSASGTPISISPQSLLTVFALLAAVTLAIGIGFAVAGAWLVLPFAGAEVIGLAVAFAVVARRAARQHERTE